MAANFWTSSHYMNWLRNAGTMLSDAANIRMRDTELFTEKELVKMQMSYVQMISALARKTGLRQRVAATATMYFKRFYLRCGFIDHDPRLIAPVALYLAAKVEEHTVPAKTIVSQMNALYKSKDHNYPYSVADLYSYEFRLIAELDFDLIVYHPYRPLMQYCEDSTLSPYLQVAWALVNDSYRTDVCLQHPPYLIAIAAIYMAGTLEDNDMRPWLRKLDIDACDLAEVVKTMSSVYAPSKVTRNPGKDNLNDVINAKLQTQFCKPKSSQTSNALQKQSPQQQQQLQQLQQQQQQQQTQKKRQNSTVATTATTNIQKPGSSQTDPIRRPNRR